MSAGDIDSVTSQLAGASVDAAGILSFAGKGIKLDNETDAQPIVEEIRKCTCLKALRLEGNTMGVEAAKAIAKALEKHPEFQRALWSDMFTGRLKSEIPQALRYLGNAIMLSGAQLTVLDLSDNAFGPNGMEGLTDFLKSKSCFLLRELKLNNNGLGVTGGKMLAKSLLECHKNSVEAKSPLGLRVFVSGRGRLENEGSIALAEAFKAMGTLEEVQMPQNGINHPGITALAEAFASNKNLRHLNLNDNTFTEKGAAAMAKALPHLQNLEILNFGDCLLRTGGAESIAQAIDGGLTKLKTCTFSFNEIGKSGALALAEAMKDKTSLEKLDLDGNQIGESGIEDVQQLMGVLELDDRLGGFSDDEGSDDEDDEDDEEEDEAPEDDQDGEEVSDPALSIQGTALTPRSEKEVKPSDFMAFPSPTKFDQMGKDKARADAMLEYVGDDIDNTDKVAQTIVKMSSIVTEKDEKTKTGVCQCADALLSKLYESGEGSSVNLVNSLLVNLGLLKGEEKVRAPSDISGSLIVLDHVVQQSYFPKDARDILQVFLSRPHSLLDASSSYRHQLLQTLFRL